MKSAHVERISHFIVHLLGETKKQLGNAGLSTENIDQVMGRLKGLTVKDKNAFEVFKSKNELTTEGFAKVSKVSRSTASSRLNRLFSFGLLEKKTDGKKIMYKMSQFFTIENGTQQKEENQGVYYAILTLKEKREDGLYSRA